MNINKLDDLDVTPICSNCKYEGENWTCKCQQKVEDINNHCERPKINDFCGYFEEQDWIKHEREKGSKNE